MSSFLGYTLILYGHIPFNDKSSYLNWIKQIQKKRLMQKSNQGEKNQRGHEVLVFVFVLVLVSLLRTKLCFENQYHSSNKNDNSSLTEINNAYKELRCEMSLVRCRAYLFHNHFNSCETDLDTSFNNWCQ